MINNYQTGDQVHEEVDFIIVGQGIAGTALSWELQKIGARVLVFDHTNPQSSSRVAAGLYNPITGRNMVKTWKADQLFPVIEPFYLELDELLKIHSLHPTGIYRPFFTNEECNDWQSKMSAPEYAPYIASVESQSIAVAGINDPLGGIKLRKAGYVDLSRLLDGYKKWLNAKGIYRNHLFKSDNLELLSDGAVYGEYKAAKVIYCRGMDEDDSFFSWLPFTPVKGELMDVECEAGFDFILNRGVFLVPLGAKNFRLGSTYTRSSTQVFDDGAEKELKEKLSVIYSEEISVKERKVGIRPATKDRKPFVGLHPEHSQLGVFNGFGSKGVSMTPYFAHQFARHLVFGEGIDAEVDIQRYYSLSS